MKPITLRPFTPADAPQVFALEQAYSAQYPGVPVFPGEMYLSPAYHGGQDVFCALCDGQVIGYAPLYAQWIESGPAELPHLFWTEIKVHPEWPEIDFVKDRLLEQVLAHSRKLLGEAGAQTRKARLTFEYRANEIESAAYVSARGFRHSDSVFSMRRDLSQDLPALSVPARIRLERWRMESQPEQERYVAARNECFPEAPVQLGDWQYFLSSPLWAVGTSIAAFDGEELAGNVAVYWDEAANAQSGKLAGYTEFIFVRPAWRGKGLAQAMIAAAMRFLREHGLNEAHLEVRALNANALNLYRDLGYEVIQESHFYAKEL
jgi:ribosomal protein S18 acetylase RimI-like enzyme